jgi:hypothetical protein
MNPALSPSTTFTVNRRPDSFGVCNLDLSFPKISSVQIRAMK